MFQCRQSINRRPCHFGTRKDSRDDSVVLTIAGNGRVEHAREEPLLKHEYPSEIHTMMGAVAEDVSCRRCTDVVGRHCSFGREYSQPSRLGSVVNTAEQITLLVQDRDQKAYRRFNQSAAEFCRIMLEDGFALHLVWRSMV